MVLSNARINTYSGVGDLALHLLSAGSFPLTGIKKPASVPKETLQKYQGLYTGPNGSFDVRYTNAFLTFSFSTAPDYFLTLYPDTTRHFSLLEPGVTASGTFNVDAAGKVVSLSWSQGGVTGVYQRMPGAVTLSISKESSGLTLTLMGDSQLSYLVESSSDLVQWQPLTTNTIWSPSLALDGLAAANFYRLRVK